MEFLPFHFVENIELENLNFDKFSAKLVSSEETTTVPVLKVKDKTTKDTDDGKYNNHSKNSKALSTNKERILYALTILKKYKKNKKK